MCWGRFPEWTCGPPRGLTVDDICLPTHVMAAETPEGDPMEDTVSAPIIVASLGDGGPEFVIGRPARKSRQLIWFQSALPAHFTSAEGPMQIRLAASARLCSWTLYRSVPPPAPMWRRQPSPGTAPERIRTNPRMGWQAPSSNSSDGAAQLQQERPAFLPASRPHHSAAGQLSPPPF